MRVIEDFDSNNYEMCKGLFYRIAIRAIIIKNKKLALIRSNKFEEFKFPGGGQEEGESDLQTLIRETMEETGLSVNPDSVLSYGMAKEKRRSILNPDDFFIMESRYYLCDVEDEIKSINLDDYEYDYGYHLHFVTIDEAIQANKKAAKKHQDVATWINRELAVLIDIKNHLNL